MLTCSRSCGDPPLSLRRLPDPLAPRATLSFPLFFFPLLSFLVFSRPVSSCLVHARKKSDSRHVHQLPACLRPVGVGRFLDSGGFFVTVNGKWDGSVIADGGGGALQEGGAVAGAEGLIPALGLRVGAVVCFNLGAGSRPWCFSLDELAPAAELRLARRAPASMPARGRENLRPVVVAAEQHSSTESEHQRALALTDLTAARPSSGRDLLLGVGGAAGSASAAGASPGVDGVRFSAGGSSYSPGGVICRQELMEDARPAPEMRSLDASQIDVKTLLEPAKLLAVGGGMRARCYGCGLPQADSATDLCLACKWGQTKQELSYELASRSMHLSSSPSSPPPAREQRREHAPGHPGKDASADSERRQRDGGAASTADLASFVWPVRKARGEEDRVVQPGAAAEQGDRERETLLLLRALKSVLDEHSMVKEQQQQQLDLTSQIADRDAGTPGAQVEASREHGVDVRRVSAAEAAAPARPAQDLPAAPQAFSPSPPPPPVLHSSSLSSAQLTPPRAAVVVSPPVRIRLKLRLDVEAAGAEGSSARQGFCLPLETPASSVYRVPVCS